MASKIKFTGWAVKYFLVTKLFIDAPESRKAKDKILAHLLMILVSGLITVMIFKSHLDTNVDVLAFGPITPTIIQEVIDFVKKLG